MSEERRVHTRYEIRLAAEISTPARTFTATTRDISAGGCCLQSAYAVDEQQELRLSLFVVVDDVEEESLPPLSLAAMVQWTAVNDEAPIDEQHLTGLRFEDLSDAQRGWLERITGPLE